MLGPEDVTGIPLPLTYIMIMEIVFFPLYGKEVLDSTGMCNSVSVFDTNTIPTLY